MVAEQTLAPQERTHRNVRERTFSLPANGTSERLRVAELAFRLSLGVGGKLFGARAAGERHGHVARDLLVDSRESGIAEFAELCGFDEEAVADKLFVVGGEYALDLERLETAFD